MRFVVVVLFVVSVSSSAVAGPVEHEARSENTALLLTAAGTALPGLAMLGGAQLADNDETVLIAGSVGLVIMPAAGQWYAGQVGAIGLGVRTVGAAALIGGFHLLEDSEAEDDRAAWLLVGGIGAIVGGIVFDAVTVPAAVRSWNARLDLHASVVPMRDGYGIGVGGAF